MDKRKFPNYLGIISKPNKYRTIMELAIVQNGYLIATDGYILGVTNLTLKYEKDEVDSLEGKVLNRDTLTKLSKSTYIKFEKDRIISNVGKITSILEYSGTIDDLNNVKLYNKINGELVDHGKYPDYKKVMYGVNIIADRIEVDLSTFNKPYHTCINANYFLGAANALLTESCIILGSEEYKPLLILRHLDENNNIDISDFVLLTKSGKPENIENAILM